MTFITITVTGLDQVIATLNRKNVDIQEATRNVHINVGNFLVRELKNNAHQITGNLKNSIMLDYADDRAAVVSVHAPYAVYENRRPGAKAGFGPHNFADRAVQTTIPELAKQVKAEFDQALQP